MQSCRSYMNNSQWNNLSFINLVPSFYVDKAGNNFLRTWLLFLYCRDLHTFLPKTIPFTCVLFLNFYARCPRRQVPCDFNHFSTNVILCFLVVPEKKWCTVCDHLVILVFLFKAAGYAVIGQRQPGLGWLWPGRVCVSPYSLLMASVLKKLKITGFWSVIFSTQQMSTRPPDLGCQCAWRLAGVLCAGRQTLL